MANSTTGFQGLTLTPVFVTTFAGALTGSLTSGTVVAAILDPVAGINRVYNPYTVGFSGSSGPQTGDAASVWLPAVSTAGATAVVVNDQYWNAVPGNSTPQPNNKVGQVLLNLVPAAKDTVRSSSVMNFRLSPQAIVFTTSSTF